MAFPPNFDNVWDITQPPDTQLANLLGQDIRNLKDDIMQRMSLLSGTFANRPTPETVNAVWGGSGFGLLYFSTDTSQIFQWSGAAWVDISASFLSLGVKTYPTNLTPVTGNNISGASGVVALQNILIPANDLVAGSVLNIEASGTLGPNGGTGTGFLFYIVRDGNVDLSSGLPLETVVYNTGAATYQWRLRASITILTSGVGGTVDPPFMEFSAFHDITANMGVKGTPSTIDTTINHQIGLAVAFNLGSTTNSVTENVLNIFKVR